MDLIRKNKLTKADHNKINSLILKCAESDSVQPLIFTDDDINFLQDYKCFNLTYEDDILINFLSVFIPGDGSAEIYTFTNPDYRKNGIVSNLLNMILSELTEKGIAKALLVCDPDSTTAVSIINNKNLEISYSEFLLKLKEDYRTEIIDYFKNKKYAIFNNASNIEKLLDLENSDLNIYKLSNEHDQNDDITTLQLELFSDSTFIGSCLVEMEDETATIYDFFVDEHLRGKGYGTYTLMKILDYLTDDFAQNIILQLHGDNKKATSLYLNHGFQIENQVDYVRLKKVW